MSSNPATRERMLEWQFNIGAPSRPTTFWVGFNESDPGTTGAGESAELGRIEVANWAIGTVDDGIVQNSDAGASGAATGATTIAFFSIHSLEVGGVYQVGGPLNNSRTLALGESLTWNPADLTASIG
jgi:hypothetical protein